MDKNLWKTLEIITSLAKKLAAISLVVLILFANILFLLKFTGGQINPDFLLVSQVLVLMSLVFMAVYFLGLGVQKFHLTFGLSKN